MTEVNADAVYTDGSAWAAGPQRVYDRLAVKAVDVVGAEVGGATVLDVGAGTGAMTRALRGLQAAVVAADLSSAMLRELRRQVPGTPTLVSDVTRLGLADGAVDAAVSGFVVNHLADPAAAVREMARVTRPGGWVLATTFGADDHPVKDAINQVLVEHGWTPPQWYLDIKDRFHPLTATPDACRQVLTGAGLGDGGVAELDVDFADLTPAEVANYRLGMAHSAAFVASLPEPERDAVTAEATRRAGQLPPLHLPMLVLYGRAYPT